MSYLVFARKWRPLTFDDVVGQEHITQTLKKAIEKERVAHAYIFTGTRGVGKTTTARILARALNCDNGPTSEPCGECESCKGVIQGASMDVLEIDGASNNKVDDIRDLRDNIGYTSMSGKHRVFVIDEVHMLTTSAFNALLKTLEEPPPKVIFIFATTEPHKIPATIQSRCQRFDFRRISTTQIREQLEKICVSEEMPHTSEGLHLLARKAEGSMRDALSLLDQIYSYGQETIGEAEVRMVLGIVGAEVYLKLMDAVANKDPEPVLQTVQDVLYHGYDLHEFIVGLEEHVRNLLFARIPKVLAARAEEIPAESADMYRAQAEKFAEGTLLRMAELIRKTEHDLKWSSFPRFAVEALLLKLVHMDQSVSLENLLQALGNSNGASSAPPTVSPPEKKKPEPRPQPTLTSDPPPPQPQTQPQPQTAPDISATEPEENTESFSAETEAKPVRDLEGEWPAFLKELIDARPNLGSFLSHAHMAACKGSTVDLRFATAFKFHFDEVTKRQNRAFIEKKLAEFAGAPITLHMTLEQEHHTDAQPPNYLSQITDTVPSLQDEIEHEPIIKTVLEAFDGEVIE